MSSIALVGPIGPLEIGIVLLIVLIIFGPKRLPELGRSLGSGFRGFKDSVTGKDRDEDSQERLEAPATVAGERVDAEPQHAAAAQPAPGETTASGAHGDGRS